MAAGIKKEDRVTSAVVWLLCKLFTPADLRRLSKKIWYAAARLDSQVKT
jgi:hypothetical protein